jgi:hypothetical protein
VLLQTKPCLLTTQKISVPRESAESKESSSARLWGSVLGDNDVDLAIRLLAVLFLALKDGQSPVVTGIPDWVRAVRVIDEINASELERDIVWLIVHLELQQLVLYFRGVDAC